MAKGEPPNIPFWLGEAPPRSDELSHSVSRLRATLAQRLERGDGELMQLTQWMSQDIGAGEGAARQVIDYLSAVHTTLGAMPTQDTLVLERFFG